MRIFHVHVRVHRARKQSSSLGTLAWPMGRGSEGVLLVPVAYLFLGLAGAQSNLLELPVSRVSSVDAARWLIALSAPTHGRWQIPASCFFGFEHPGLLHKMLRSCQAALNQFTENADIELSFSVDSESLRHSPEARFCFCSIEQKPCHPQYRRD